MVAGALALVIASQLELLYKHSTIEEKGKKKRMKKDLPLKKKCKGWLTDWLTDTAHTDKDGKKKKKKSIKRGKKKERQKVLKPQF